MPKPILLPKWAIGPTAIKTAPTTSQEDVGYNAGDLPTHAEFNFLFELIYEWIVFIDDDLADGSTNNTNAIASVKKTFVYIDLTTYDAITGPTLNDTINRKSSNLKEIIDTSVDTKIQTAVDTLNTTISDLRITLPGMISGFEYTGSGGTTVTFKSGIGTLHLSTATTWTDDQSKLLLTNFVASGGSSRYIKVGSSDWAFAGIDGIMAPGVLGFAAGISVYFFVLDSGPGLAGIPIVLADTDPLGTKAVTRYRALFSLGALDLVFLRRIGATITHLTGSTILGRDTQNKGNRFFQIQTHIAAPQRAILVDASGLFGGATPPFQGNDPFIIPDIVTLNLAPLINGASYHCVFHASGTAADQQDLELISTTKEQFGVPSIAPYGANGDIVTSVVTYKMEMGQKTVSIDNVSSAAPTAADSILYLDIGCDGWTDHREEETIG